MAREVILALATADVLPADLRQRLAGAALLVGFSPAQVAPLLVDGPHVCRVAAEVAGALLLLGAEDDRPLAEDR